MTYEAAYIPDALASSVQEFERSSSAEPSLTISEPVEFTDERLLEQLRSGSREALAQLFRRYAHAVRNVAYRILRNESEADDLVQDVFLAIFHKASLYDPAQGKAATWIIHMTYNRAFDRRRYLITRHFYTSRELEETSMSLADSKRVIQFHEKSIDGVLGKGMMVEFNTRLTAEQRETIQMFFFEGYTLREIAELTGRSLFNVRSHYYRGLDRLRKYFLPQKLRSK
jgi:RNA polymerase sigma-70 factor, ECF subfamily